MVLLTHLSTAVLVRSHALASIPLRRRAVALMAQHLFPRVPDVHGMGVPHDLERCLILPACARVPDPLDQEMAEAAIPGQDRSVIAPVLAVVAAEAARYMPARETGLEKTFKSFCLMKWIPCSPCGMRTARDLQHERAYLTRSFQPVADLAQFAAAVHPQ